MTIDRLMEQIHGYLDGRIGDLVHIRVALRDFALCADDTELDAFIGNAAHGEKVLGEFTND